MDSLDFWVDLLDYGLKEDHWHFDWSSLTFAKSKIEIKAQVVSKSDGIWAADGLLSASTYISQKLNLPVEILSHIQNGKSFKKGEVLIEWKGNARGILALERPFLNLASYVCGIATQTKKQVFRFKKIEGALKFLNGSRTP